MTPRVTVRPLLNEGCRADNRYAQCSTDLHLNRSPFFWKELLNIYVAERAKTAAKRPRSGSSGKPPQEVCNYHLSECRIDQWSDTLGSLDRHGRSF